MEKQQLFLLHFIQSDAVPGFFRDQGGQSPSLIKSDNGGNKLSGRDGGEENLPGIIGSNLIGLGKISPFPGQSLKRYWKIGRQRSLTENEVILSELTSWSGALEHEPISKGKMNSLVDGRFHYIRNGDGSVELYDFEEDPFEEENLAEFDNSRTDQFNISLDSALNEK